MRIIGGHDYYDSALAWGQDQSVVFVRNKQPKAIDRYKDLPPGLLLPNPTLAVRHEKKDQKWRIYNYPSLVHKDLRVSIHADVAVIADTVYNGVCIVTDQQAEHFWHWSAVEAWAARHEMVAYDAHKAYSLNHYIGPEYFESATINHTLRDWMITNHVSTITVENQGYWGGSWMLGINTPSLKDLGLQRRIDPYTCFQNISMWVEGILPNPGPDMVQITDDRIKIAKHGFDKWSFRKPPQ